MKIKNIILRQIFDSRGEETIEIDLATAESDSFWAQIPSGKSRGKNEAAVLSFAGAKKSLKTAAKNLIGRDFNSIKELDDFLISLDGAENKSNLGGNLMLGISIAFSRALAFENSIDLWKLLNIEFFNGDFLTNLEQKKPLIFSNVINGGAHANDNLDIQEYMVVTGNNDSLADSVKKLVHFYKELGKFLKEKSIGSLFGKLPIGDEGGYSLNFKNNAEPLEIMEELIKKMKLGKEFVLGIDAAASNFYRKGKYIFDRKSLNSDGLNEIYKGYLKIFKNLYSIEDPFAEEDFDGFKKLSAEAGENKIVVGDDLTVTNPKLIDKFAKEDLINCVIIKPNQIGTVSESCEAMKAARKNKIGAIVSHRSGETNDNFIIHLAKAGNADGVKLGAPIRERIYKFNELMRIYD